MSMFSRNPGEDLRTENPATPARRFTDRQIVDTVIGPNARIKGEVEGKTNLEVKGTLEGICRIEGLIRVCEGGSVLGNVNATNVVIEGEVKGNLDATENLELRATSRIEGDIRAAKLAMAEGCYIKGKIDMSTEDVAPRSSEATTFKEKRGGEQRGKTEEE